MKQNKPTIACLIADLQPERVPLRGYRLFRERHRWAGVCDTKISRVLHRLLKGSFPSLSINPRISVVTTSYNKEREVPYFIEGFLRQTFPYDFELVCIDDGSTDRTPLIIREYADRLYRNRKYGFTREGGMPYPEIVLSAQEENRGQCAARNLGIGLARAGIVVILDADCVPGREFLRAHLRAYEDPSIGAASGPMDLETQGAEPMGVVRRYEAEPELVLRDMQLQDAYEPRSFLNCVPRNFSARRHLLLSTRFDTAFSYESSDPTSGYGWEDIDLAMRLYERNVRFEFARDAFSVHISHPPVFCSTDQPLRSLKNFLMLIEKHPDLKRVARAWTARTYGRIREWMEERGFGEGVDSRRCDELLAGVFPDRHPVAVRKRLKILSTPFDAEYQYELARLAHDYIFITDKAGPCGGWDFMKRPLPLNIRLGGVEETQRDDIDLVVVPFDEYLLGTGGSSGSPHAGKAALCRRLLDQSGVPAVCLYRGSPRPGMDTSELINLIGDRLVVLSSFEAQKNLRFRRSKVIWPGLDPQHYRPTAGCTRIATVDTGKYRDDDRRMHSRITRHLPAVWLKQYELQYGGAGKIPAADAGAAGMRAYWRYIVALGRYGIYFNPGRDAAMEFPLLEAMLCGLAVVSVRSDDLERFIRHGVNGFMSDDEDELRSCLERLVVGDLDARLVGMRGRERAMDLFSYDRFLSEWQRVLAQHGGGGQ
ncbi:MAG: glycosyltransferase [Candidatus Aureabacteria bacterium]|nr:glycosyltransferase [Candidatus Auribacterota bacterium]